MMFTLIHQPTTLFGLKFQQVEEPRYISHNSLLGRMKKEEAPIRIHSQTITDDTQTTTKLVHFSCEVLTMIQTVAP